MKATTRRLLLAILAWPVGCTVAVIWMFVSAEPVACDPGPTCMAALKPAPFNETLELLALAFAPGVFATIHWWRNRASDDADART